MDRAGAMAELTKSSIVTVLRGRDPLHFTRAGWFNATEAAARYGKRLDNWFRLDGTQEYIAALAAELNSLTSEPIKTGSGVAIEADLVVTRRGRYNSGTWLHPALAVVFARWLDVRFGIWCDQQIRQILAGQHPHFERQKLRHAAAASFKVMTRMLQLTRGDAGKTTQAHHYSNEARLVNWALSGNFAGIDRDELPAAELDLLAVLEAKNSVYIARGLPYRDRKVLLQQAAQDWRDQQLIKLGAAA